MNKEKKERLEAAMDYMERATARDNEARKDRDGYPIDGSQKDVLNWMIKNDISLDKLDNFEQHTLHEAQYANQIYELMKRDAGFVEKMTAKIFASTYIHRYDRLRNAVIDYKKMKGAL